MNQNENRIQELIRKCTKKEITISTAESCTGGMIATLLTDIPGSSAVFYGSCVTYTNEIKKKLLGVSPELIEHYSEVSHSCAKAMAVGVRKALGTTLAVSTTGYAGPTGGTPADPVGTVYIAIATPNGTFSERLSLPSTQSRAEIRSAAAERALDMLCRYVQEQK